MQLRTYKCNVCGGEFSLPDTKKNIIGVEWTPSCGLRMVDLLSAAETHICIPCLRALRGLLDTDPILKGRLDNQ